MKDHLFVIILVAVALLGGPRRGQAQTTGDLEVFPNENAFVVRGKINLKEYLKTADAGEAIQYALDQFGGQGGSVYLHTGRYDLHRQVDVPSRITLSGSGTATKLIFANDHDTGTALRCKASDNAQIKDLSIHAHPSNDSAKIGILIDDSGSVVVDNVSCIGMRGHGIVLANNSFLCTINSCRVAATGKSGILIKDLFKGGRGGDWVPSQVSNCIVYASGKGIECEKSLVINISDCQIYQTEGHAFHIHSESNSVMITGARTYQITGSSVLVENSHEINLSGNVFSWSTEDGIILNDVKWGAIAGNNIIDNGSINLFDPDTDPFIKADNRRPFAKDVDASVIVPNYNGITLKNKTMGIAITGNSIYNWHVVPPMKHGIEEDSTCFGNNFSANNINYCVREGIASQGKESLIGENVIYTDEAYYRLNSQKPGTRERPRKYQYFDTRLIRTFIQEINVKE